MKEYNPLSMKAEEFISHEEILETLKYADENKDNLPLIKDLLEKARPKRDGKKITCRGLSYREASILLACEDEKITEKIYEVAREIKYTFYGNRIVMFARLFL